MNNNFPPFPNKNQKQGKKLPKPTRSSSTLFDWKWNSNNGETSTRKPPPAKDPRFIPPKIWQRFINKKQNG